jgi:hypothetical protein
MDADNFEHIFDEQIDMCRDTLVVKAKEYATEDRLHNFKVAAELEGCTVRQAVAGMLAKHTISIFDMCQSGNVFPMAVWEEKITDHINYLILLKAVVNEELNECVSKKDVSQASYLPISERL